MAKIRYEMVVASPESIAQEVQSLLDQGYQLYGNPFAISKNDDIPGICQALTLEQPSRGNILQQTAPKP